MLSCYWWSTLHKITCASLFLKMYLLKTCCHSPNLRSTAELYCPSDFDYIPQWSWESLSFFPCWLFVWRGEHLNLAFHGRSTGNRIGSKEGSCPFPHVNLLVWAASCLVLSWRPSTVRRSTQECLQWDTLKHCPHCCYSCTLTAHAQVAEELAGARQ